MAGEEQAINAIIKKIADLLKIRAGNKMNHITVKITPFQALLLCLVNYNNTIYNFFKLRATKK